MNQPVRYSGALRALHWLSALAIVALIVVGVYMADLADNDPSRPAIYAMHKSVGVLTLFLLAARLIWLRLTPAPGLPAVFGEREKAVTKGIRSMLYLLMFLVPVSGWVMSNAAGYPVSFFGLFDLPTLLEKSRPIGRFTHEMHELMGFAIAGLVLLHVAGAVKHRLADKGGPSDVLARML